MQIRLLSPDDAPAFKAFRIAAVMHDPVAFYPTAEELGNMSLEKFAARLDTNAGEHVFAAFVNDKMVGILGCRHEILSQVQHKAFIWGVATKPECRGRGLARCLMQAAIAHARDGGLIQKITLSVYDQNLPAKALYAGMGFKTWALEENAMCLNGAMIAEEWMALEIAGVTKLVNSR